MPAGGPVQFDRRRLRSERSRLSIIKAYIALLRESLHAPTADLIAERAGVSTRLVFERFPDLLSVRIAAADYAILLANRHARIRDADADRQTRIQSDVSARAQTSEVWLPLWRALNLDLADSPELKARKARVLETLWRRSEIMYRAELSTLDARDRRALLFAIEAITDFEVWGRMRSEEGLTEQQARAIWTRSIDRLLPPTPRSYPDGGRVGQGGG